MHIVVEGLLGAFLQGVFHASHVAQVDACAVACAHHYVLHLLGIAKFALHAQRVGFVTYIERTAGDVAVFGTYNRGYAFYGEVVGFEADRIDINIYFAFGSTAHRHRTNAVDTSQWVGYEVVEDFIKSRSALVGFDREQQDWNHIGAELEDERGISFIG